MNTVTVQLTDTQFAAINELTAMATQLLADRLAVESDAGHRQDLLNELALSREITEALLSTKAYLWTSSCGRLNLEIPAEAVEQIAASGDNEAAVRDWLEGESTNYLRAQVERLDTELVKEHLSEGGIEDVEVKYNDELRRLLLWTACWDIADDPEG